MALDPFDQKIAIMLEEWKQVQFHIGRMDTLIFNVRQWCVTIVSGFIAASATIHSPLLMLLASIPVVLLWFQDALYKSYQWEFINRGQDIENYLLSPAFNAGIISSRNVDEIKSPRMSSGFSAYDLDSPDRIQAAALIVHTRVLYLGLLLSCLFVPLLIYLFSGEVAQQQ